MSKIHCLPDSVIDFIVATEVPYELLPNVACSTKPFEETSSENLVGVVK